LSTGAGLDANAIALPGSVAKKIKLGAGQHMAIAYKLAGIPASVPAGTYHLVFQMTDSAGGIATAVSGGTITVAPATIDLSGAFSKVPVTAAAGKKLSFTFSITNHGNTTLSGLLPLEIDASAGGKSDAFVTLGQLGKAIKHAAGKTARMTVSLPVTSDMPASSYLTVRLDPANALGDANPGDNSFTSLQPIVIKL